MAHDNDYSVIAFFPMEKPKSWEFVHKLNGFADFLNREHPDWKYMNVYDRRSTKFLKRLYKGNSIPEFL
jgi:hypothetical protein